MDITSDYVKYRSTFGRQLMFCEVGPVMCDSIPVSSFEHKNYMLRNPVHQPTQNTLPCSEHFVNTIRAEYTTTGINHAEGGWPRDVNILDPEATQRYRRKVEKEENYLRSVQTLTPSMDYYVLQNNAIDMYQSYFSDLPMQPELEEMKCRTMNVYRAPGGQRAVSSICWQPKGTQFAVTYNNVDFYRCTQHPLTCYLWELEDANAPVVTIEPPEPMLDLQYNPRAINMLGGGLMNGQVAVWDRRIGGNPSIICAPHVAHRDLVRNLLFINAKSGREFMSASADGSCRWWDVRNLNDFIEEIIIDILKTPQDRPSMATSNGVSALEFEPTIPTRFMVGTENGMVFGGNRKGKTAFDKLPVKFGAHVGPVVALQRNPHFLKNFLTVGDWTARIWAEDCRESAVIWTEPNRHKLTDGTWSPKRFSLMVLTQWNGMLTMWDLLRRQHEPIISMQVCTEPLLRLQFNEAGSLLACGSNVGNIHVIEVSKSLTTSNKNDKAMMTAIFERESKRERILEARLREIRLKQRQTAEERSPQPSSMLLDPAVGDHDLAEATAQYFASIKKDKDHM